MISHTSITVLSLMLLGSTAVACALPVSDVDDDQSVAAAARRAGSRSNGAESDGGVPAVPLPPTLIRGNYTLPITADVAYREMHELDCHGDNAVWKRSSYFPVVKEDIDRLGALLVRYYSMVLGQNGIEDPGTGIGQRFAPLAGSTLTYADGPTSLRAFEFFGVPLPGNTNPFHVSIAATSDGMTGFYEGASVIRDEVTPIRACAFKPISHTLAEMAWWSLQLDLGTGIACNVASGERAGSNVIMHPITGKDIVKLGGSFLSYYEGTLEGSWLEQKRTGESIFYRPSRDVTSTTLSYAPVPGTSDKLDYYGVSNAGNVRIQFTQDGAYTWNGQLDDGSVLSGCRLVMTPSFVRKLEAERLVHVGLPLSNVTEVTP